MRVDVQPPWVKDEMRNAGADVAEITVEMLVVGACFD
jgi:hypothetical protein